MPGRPFATPARSLSHRRRCLRCRRYSLSSPSSSSSFSHALVFSEGEYLRRGMEEAWWNLRSNHEESQLAGQDQIIHACLIIYSIWRKFQYTDLCPRHCKLIILLEPIYLSPFHVFSNHDFCFRNEQTEAVKKCSLQVTRQVKSEGGVLGRPGFLGFVIPRLPCLRPRSLPSPRASSSTCTAADAIFYLAQHWNVRPERR